MGPHAAVVLDQLSQLSGTLAVNRGGTGATDAATARTNLGAGTVTSVALTVPATLFTSPVSGTPITSSGTLALALKTQVANTVFCGPSTGADAAPTFRALVAADLPAALTPTTVNGLTLASTSGVVVGTANTQSGPTTTICFGTGNTVGGRAVVVGNTCAANEGVVLGRGVAVGLTANGDAVLSPATTGNSNLNGRVVMVGMVSDLTWARSWQIGSSAWATNTSGAQLGRFAVSVFNVTTAQTAWQVDAASDSPRHTFAGAVAWTAASVTVSADTNDWAPGNGKRFRVTPNGANRTVTGLSMSQVSGQEVEIVNVGSNNLTLSNQSASSTAANRFLCISGADIVLAPNEEAWARYDATTSRWRVAKR